MPIDEKATPYCPSLTHYRRLLTHEVKVGDVPLGGLHPIRIQSMTTTDTMDTAATVAQSLRMVAAGCEYVRITAPSLKEAENLRAIKDELRRQGCRVPLVADIHFTPNAAETAARIVEKVRVNPGNYADKKRFEQLDYSDSSYQAELERIYKRFAPLVKICKEYGTAMRIGTNHGSLSDRIMSRYGDSPQGMVESALEFIHIAEDLDYNQLVISMKASNPQVMVQAYRLLAQRMIAGDTKFIYPLHLGVTEAGDGEDGRIKSAMGIGTLLADGLGDTVRVSLTEPPEAEIPVAQYIVNRFINQPPKMELPDAGLPIDPFSFARHSSLAVANFGHGQLPRVISDFSHKPVLVDGMRAVGHSYNALLDKWTMAETGTDYIYAGPREVPFMLPNGIKSVYDAALWQVLPDKTHSYPYFSDYRQYIDAEIISDELNFVHFTVDDFPANLDWLAEKPVVAVLEAEEPFAMLGLRNLAFRLASAQIPYVLKYRVQPDDNFAAESAEGRYQLSAATALGLLLVDGLCDGIWLTGEADASLANRTAFGLLQAGRLRTTKTEYISCPSCGRTLFDLQETTALIRSRTEHLKGVKIGIMGCIVNGPGEMADADFGYVGAGPGIITLYKGKEVMAAKVPTAEAVDRLIELIKAYGQWVEPEPVFA